MAKLLLPSYHCGPKNEIDFEKQQDEYEELKNSHPLVRWHVADNYAVYRVVCLGDTPVLQHVQYMDGYTKSDVFVRGLRSEDVKSQLSQEEISSLPESIENVSNGDLPDSHKIADV